MKLEDIKSPQDIKNLSIAELTKLSADLRQAFLKRASLHYGHVGPNLGVVELTVGFHYVFNSPIDKLVFDVSHQSYIHKMLTGRMQAYLDPAHFDDVSGYTNPDESEHDFFNIGHTSTSISLASGLAKARDLKGTHENIVALIGDGSLSGGEAFEGLDYLSELGTNFIAIINDNDQSIAEVHGGINLALKELRDTDGKSSKNIFKALGLDYRFIADANDLEAVIKTFEEVKDIDHPVVIHAVTQKGKGYKFAEIEKERWHWSMPFDIETGEVTNAPAPSENYISVTLDYITKKMAEDKTVFAVNAATPGMFGFDKAWRDAHKEQYVDVGIAEEQAVAMVSGAAKNGAKPVFFVVSTFIQRTYDQIMQDLCVNSNPAVIINCYASVSALNDVTHLGIFDIAMLSNIPNLVYLAPTSKEEHLAMLDWALTQRQYSVAIRLPVAELRVTGQKDNTDYSKLNTFEVTHKGSQIALVGLGNFYPLALEVAAELKKNGIDATVINPKFISGVDNKVLDELKSEHKVVFTLEDGIIEGGFGQKIASYLGTSNLKVKNYGLTKLFHDRYNPKELLKENGVSVEQIVADAIALLK